MNKHNHYWVGCEHKNLSFCKHCSVPFCNDCGKEWQEKVYNWIYGYPYSNYYNNLGGVPQTQTANLATASAKSCSHESK